MPLDVEAIKHCRLADLEHSSPKTIRVQMFWTGRFLEFAKGRQASEWNKSLVGSFMKKLEREGYAVETIRSAMAAVKRTFDAAREVHERQRADTLSSVDLSGVNPDDPGAIAKLMKCIGEIQRATNLPGPRWDVGKRFMPPGARIFAPALTIGEIGRMITAAKKGKLEIPEVCYLALASTYGLRAGELRAVRPGHIDYEARTIWIETEKGGEKRAQLLAPQIIPHLRRYGFTVEMTEGQTYAMFKRICVKSGVGVELHKNWHSFRRYLNEAIRDTFAGLEGRTIEPMLASHIWLRWKLASSGEISDLYYTKSRTDVDKLIIPHHPVLPLWDKE